MGDLYVDSWHLPGPVQIRWLLKPGGAKNLHEKISFCQVNLKEPSNIRGAFEEAGTVSLLRFFGDTISPSESGGLTVEDTGADLSGFAGTNVVTDWSA